jgi:hypothetical protein
MIHIALYTPTKHCNYALYKDIPLPLIAAQGNLIAIYCSIQSTKQLQVPVQFHDGQIYLGH